MEFIFTRLDIVPVNAFPGEVGIVFRIAIVVRINISVLIPIPVRDVL